MSAQGSSPPATQQAPGDRQGLPPCWEGPARGFDCQVEFCETTRPWNWVELDEIEATKLWSLLEGFVAFFNARYTDRPDQRIPPCWAEHGALVEELTTLFWARWRAFESEHGSIGGAQYWHTVSVPGFFERIARWLGTDRLERCQQGLHEDRGDLPRAKEGEWSARTKTISEGDGFLRPSPESPSPCDAGVRRTERRIVVRFFEREQD